MMTEDLKNRFEKIGTAGVLEQKIVYVDRDTGVQYLFISSGNAGGLTVLVDSDGKPLLHPDYARSKL